MRWDQAQTVHRIGNRNVSDLIILVADHRPEMSFVGQLDGFNAEACAEDPIEGGRWAAALQMSEHAGSRFFSSAFGDFARNHIADSAEAKFAALDIALNLLAILRARAFGDDNE